MRIAHIVGSLESRYGGPSRSVRHLAAATAELGHDVDILTSAPTAESVENAGRLHVHTWRRGWPGAFGPIPGLAAHLRRTTYDLLHYHGLWLRSLHYARKKAASDQVPLVVSPRGMMSTWAWRHHRAQKIFAARCLHPGALPAVAGWHATSPSEREEIARRGFTQPVCVAPNGVEQLGSSELSAAKKFWQEHAPATATKPVALFYSRFHHKKRVIELIDLWAATAPADWLLLMVGVPEEFSVGQLRDYVHRSSATGRIEIHDGSNRPAPYAVGSLFLLPSHNENFGLVIAEAMAAGVPTLVTDTTPWTALQTEQLGWCVPWSDYGVTLQATTAEGPSSLRNRGSRARTWVLRDFSWQKSAEKIVAFYNNLSGMQR